MYLLSGCVLNVTIWRGWRNICENVLSCGLWCAVVRKCSLTLQKVTKIFNLYREGTTSSDNEISNRTSLSSRVEFRTKITVDKPGETDEGRRGWPDTHKECFYFVEIVLWIVVVVKEWYRRKNFVPSLLFFLFFIQRSGFLFFIRRVFVEYIMSNTVTLITWGACPDHVMYLTWFTQRTWTSVSIPLQWVRNDEYPPRVISLCILPKQYSVPWICG